VGRARIARLPPVPQGTPRTASSGEAHARGGSATAGAWLSSHVDRSVCQPPRSSAFEAELCRSRAWRTGESTRRGGRDDRRGHCHCVQVCTCPRRARDRKSRSVVFVTTAPLPAVPSRGLGYRPCDPHGESAGQRMPVWGRGPMQGNGRERRDRRTSHHGRPRGCVEARGHHGARAGSTIPRPARRRRSARDDHAAHGPHSPGQHHRPGQPTQPLLAQRGSRWSSFDRPKGLDAIKKPALVRVHELGHRAPEKLVLGIHAVEHTPADSQQRHRAHVSRRPTLATAGGVGIQTSASGWTAGDAGDRKPKGEIFGSRSLAHGWASPSCRLLNRLPASHGTRL
jgi:hypothetical protein